MNGKQWDGRNESRTGGPIPTAHRSPVETARKRLNDGAPQLLCAAEAMLAAFDGNVPTWLRAKFTALEAAVWAVKEPST